MADTFKEVHNFFERKHNKPHQKPKLQNCIGRQQQEKTTVKLLLRWKFLKFI